MMRLHSPVARRAHPRVGIALGVAVVLTAGGCGSAGAPGARSTVTPGGGTPGVGTATASPHNTAPLRRPGAWQLLPPAPATASLSLTVSVWTGSQMLIHGLAQVGNSGNFRGVTLSYIPATRRWRTLAPGPAPTMIQNGEVALWAGSEMLILGLTNAAYNPATNTWRRIARYNGPVGAVYVWTGHQVILWGGGCCGHVTAEGAAYTPATNSWRALPPSPLSARHTTGAWTGTELIVAGGWRPPTDTAGHARAFADAAAYNPTTRTWRRLPPMPEARSGAMVLWDGTEVLYLGGTLAGAHAPSADGIAFNPSTGRWRRLPAMEFNRAAFAAVWTGHQVLVWGGVTGASGFETIPPHGVAYGPAANRWSALPQAPLRGRAWPMAVWTGREMIVWGGTIPSARGHNGLSDGAAYRPAPR
jgi:hypothetical protein